MLAKSFNIVNYSLLRVNWKHYNMADLQGNAQKNFTEHLTAIVFGIKQSDGSILRTERCDLSRSAT